MRIPILLPSTSILRAPSSSILEVTLASFIPIAFNTSDTNFTHTATVSSLTFASSDSFFCSGSFTSAFSSLISSAFSFLNSFLCSFFDSLCSFTISFFGSSFTSSATGSSFGSSFFLALITACFIPIPRNPALPFSITS